MRIILDIPYSAGHFENVLRGTFEEKKRCGVDIVWSWGGPAEEPVAILNEGHVDGVLATGYGIYPHEHLMKAKCPVILVSSIWMEAGLPRVCPDNRSAGLLAAEYLQEKGFRSFAAVGHDRAGHEQRVSAFKSGLGKGFKCPVIFPETGKQNSIRDWLAALPNETAIFLSTDHLGSPVIRILQELGRHIPDEIAVLGVDNNALLCEMNTPPLSSIDVQGQQVGQLALRRLIQWIEDGRKPRKMETVPPASVVERASTDVLAYKDAFLRRALAFIARSHGPVTVDVVARHAGCGKRSLQQKFKEEFGQSIHAAITNHRLRQVNELLRETNLPMAEIADLAGFSDYFCLANWYRRKTGNSLKAARHELRG